MTDEIHERSLERAKRIVSAFEDALPTNGGTASVLAAAFQAAGDALHAEADAATEQRKRGHQSLTKDLRNAASRLVGIAQDLLELSKLDAVEPYTPTTDPVTSQEDVAAYLRGETDALPADLTPAERYPGEWASADAGAEGAAVLPEPAEGWAAHDAADLAAVQEPFRGGPVEPYLDAIASDPIEGKGIIVPDLAFADPEPLRSSVRWLPRDAEQYVQTFADLATPINPATLPDHLSWSQLTTLEDCGVKYRLQRLQAIPQQPQWANIGGTAFHTVTEAFDRGAWQAGGADLLPETHVELIRQRWRDAFAAEINRTAIETGIEMGETGENYRASNGGKEGYTWWLIEGERMLALYIHNRRKLDAAGRAAGQLRKPLELNPAGPIFLDTERVPVIEYAYSRKLDGPTGTITVEGIIDRAYVCSDGSLLVTDLKSGRLDPDTGQLGEYAWTLLELLGMSRSTEHPIIRGNFYDARKGLFTDPVDLLAAHPHEEYVYRYHAAEAARRLGVFLPRKSQWCNGCSVKYACPVGGA